MTWTYVLPPKTGPWSCAYAGVHFARAGTNPPVSTSPRTAIVRLTRSFIVQKFSLDNYHPQLYSYSKFGRRFVSNRCGIFTMVSPSRVTGVAEFCRYLRGDDEKTKLVAAVWTCYPCCRERSNRTVCA